MDRKRVALIVDVGAGHATQCVCADGFVLDPRDLVVGRVIELGRGSLKHLDG